MAAASLVTANQASAAADPPVVKCAIKMTKIPAGFPNCSNTGIPKGAGQSVHRGDIVMNKDSKSTTITNKIVYGRIVADGVKVTIRKTRIRSGANLKLETTNGGSIYIENSEIDGLGGGGAVAVGYGKISMKKVWVHHMVDGVRLSSNTTVRDSLFTDNVDNKSKDHNDSVQSTGSKKTTIVHSTLLAFRTGKNTQANAAVQIGSEQGPIDGLTITDSFLDGGNYTLSMNTPNTESNKFPAKNVTITNNVFGGNGKYGEIMLPAQSKVPGLKVSGNKNADGTATKIKRWK